MNHNVVCGFAAGPIIGGLVGLITVPITAWVFAPEDVGRLNVMQFAISFALLVSMLGLDRSYLREYHESGDKAQLLSSCFIPGFVLIVILGFVCSFFASEIAYALYEKEDSLLYYVTFLAILASYVSRFFSMILRMEEKGWVYSTSQIFPVIIKLILVISFFIYSIQAEFVHLQFIALASILSALFVCLVSTYFRWKNAILLRIQLESILKLLKYGLPLVLSGLAYWGLVATSAISLRLWSTLSELAVYSVANSFAGIAVIFQSIFSVMWAPLVYKLVSQNADMKIVDDMMQQVLAIFCALIALCGSLSWLCDLMLPVHYVHVKYILPCMLMQPLLYTFSEVTGVGINIKRKTMLALLVTLFAFLINLLLSYMFVPRLGASGAALANVAAFTVFFVGFTEISARIWRNFPRKRLYSYVIVVVFLVIVTVYCYLYGSIFMHTFWFMVFIFTMYEFRKQWLELAKYLCH